MRKLDDARIAPANTNIRQVLASCTKPGRRTGAIMLTGNDGRLAGLFTDSDLVRLIENHNEGALDCPIRETMNMMDARSMDVLMPIVVPMECATVMWVPCVN